MKASDITWAKYCPKEKLRDGTQLSNYTSVKVNMGGIIFHAKMDEKNRHWRGIKALVDAGEITIAEFDPDNP